MLPVNLVPIAAGVSPASLVYSVYVAPPANTVPDTPTVTVGTPASNSVGLTGSIFADDDGDDHYASQWQVTVASDAGFASPAYDSGEDLVNLLGDTATPLVQSTNYITRLRYEDDQYGWSNWSSSVAFTTAAGIDYSVGNVALPTAEYKPALVDYSGWQTYYVSSDGTRNDDVTVADYTTITAALTAAEAYRAANNANVVLKLKNGDIQETTGHIYIPTNANGYAKWIYVVPEDASFLPAEGTVIKTGTLGETPNVTTSEFPEIRLNRAGSSTHWILRCNDNADYYRFVGIKIHTDPDDAGITTGTHMFKIYSTSTLADQSDHWVIDRCWFKSEYGKALRGLVAGGPYFYVTGCEFYVPYKTGYDGQGIWAYNSPGPCTVEDCTIAAGSMGIMWGGADPASEANCPSDWTMRRIWFVKDDQWYQDEYVDFTYYYNIKNHIEVKAIKRLLIEDCVLDRFWLDAQSNPVLFKSVNQSGGSLAPGISEDITFRNCIVYNCTGCIALAASPEEPVIRELQRVAIQNVLWLKSENLSDYGAYLYGMRFLSDSDSDMKDIYVDHVSVTGVPTTQTINYSGGADLNGADVQMTNTLFAGSSTYGLFMSEDGTGERFIIKQTLVVGDNDAAIDNDGVTYQSTNAGIWPNYASQDYETLSAAVTGKGVNPDTLIADLSDLGCDFDVLRAKTNGIRSLGDVI